MKKLLFGTFLVLILACSEKIDQLSVDGHWEGVIQRMVYYPEVRPVSLDLVQEGNQVYGTLRYEDSFSFYYDMEGYQKGDSLFLRGLIPQDGAIIAISAKVSESMITGRYTFEIY